MRLNAPRPVVTGVGAAVYSVTDRVPRCLLYLVRHGETDWNAAERWQGHTDIPLNATGRAQAHVAAEALSGAGLAGIVASDLARAQETASIIAARLGIGVAYFDADLRERTFGCFEGLTRKECERLHPEAWRAWLAERRAPPGGEAPETLTARAVAGVARVAERVARVDAPALIVTHGGSMRAILTAATGEVPGPIRNGAIWRVEWDQGLVGAEPFPEER